MAKSARNNNLKKAAAKKAAKPTRKKEANPSVIRLVLDINLHTGSIAPVARTLMFKEDADKTPNFTWSFTLSGVLISSLSIGQKTIAHPDATGKVFVEVLDPDNQIIITVIGTEFTPGGSGSLAMTYEGKPIVFNPPANLLIKNGNATFNQNVSLP
ncbi:MAG: hypothetical protein KGO82_17015 [Bacteroidota bacterium]|nr:hypothetical protein [Bacteroidota bacterium]